MFFIKARFTFNEKKKIIKLKKNAHIFAEQKNIFFLQVPAKHCSRNQWIGRAMVRLLETLTLVLHMYLCMGFQLQSV